MARGSNQQSLGEVIREMIAHYRLGDKLTEANLRDTLEKSLGKDIAKHVTSIRFYKGTVTLAIANAALKHELSFSKEKIKEELNQALKNNSVEKIIIV